MYLCYVDESGTSDVPGTSSHFILAGLSIPIWHWRDADRDISKILDKYGLQHQELHTAWLLRKYVEQRRIKDFDKLRWEDRRSAVQQHRNAYLLELQKRRQTATYRQSKKNFHHTAGYIHLTFDERYALVTEVADCVANWGFARLFAECINKLYFDPLRARLTVDEQAFEQIVSRFEHYLAYTEEGGKRNFGLLVHDNNETIGQKHTKLMREFHKQGTFWTKIQRIIETPLFVDSSLTRMVQVADLCSYALRRYLENGETDLFHRIFQRADRKSDVVVGVRHFSDYTCACEICVGHKAKVAVAATATAPTPTPPPSK